MAERRDLVPAGEIVEGELVTDAGAAVVPFQTQAQRDRTIENGDEIFARIAESLAPNTRQQYQEAWRRFIRWCMDRDRTPYPLTLETLLSYLGFLAKWQPEWMTELPEEDPRWRPPGVSISTIEQFLAAARRVCLADKDDDDDKGWVGAHLKVSDWVKRYRAERNASPKTRPKQSVGARQAIMRALLDVLPDTERGIRDRAIMLLTYYMGARRSEVMNLTHADVRWTVDGLEVYIASSKTDRIGAGVWVAIPQNTRHEEYDPWTALQAWMAVCHQRGITTGPLFRAIDRWGNLRGHGEPMSGQAMELIVSTARMEAFRRADQVAKHPRTPKETRKAARIMVALLDPATVKLTPHSFRRGFATDARAAGWDLLEIARAGRWSATSRVLHLYIEEIDKWLRHAKNPMLL